MIARILVMNLAVRLCFVLVIRIFKSILYNEVDLELDLSMNGIRKSE